MNLKTALAINRKERKERSAAEPQPVSTTDDTDDTDMGNPCNPCNPCNPRSKFFAVCEQSRTIEVHRKETGGDFEPKD